MSPITALVEIKRSPQDVFLYVADPTQRPSWQDALEHIEVVRTTPEVLEHGCVRHVVFRVPHAPSPGRSPNTIPGAAMRSKESTVQSELGF
jgi:uncharacterized protein YndB with AHSA1/START domain